VVAFGALLTFTQAWFAQGVTLRQLLHSVTLAPGESTQTHQENGEYIIESN